jgi:SPP1 gp7 family putative phage head morphogenesis protein
MPSVAQLEAILRRADRLLAASETLAIRAIQRHVRASLLDLERRLARLRAQSEDPRYISDPAKREAAARLIVAQLAGVLQAFDLGAVGSGIPAELRALIIAGQKGGIDLAGKLLTAYQEPLDIRASVDLQAVQAAAENVRARLTRHSEDFGRTAEDLIVRSLIRGEGPRKSAAALAEQTGILLWEAERITRTESILAMDTSQRRTYAQAGLTLIQVTATLDSKVCGFCAYRHMRVYKLADSPIPMHPHCRCAALPWRQEWLETGLVSLEDIRASRAKLLERFEGVQHRGQTSAEKYAGKPPAVAVWSPDAAKAAA